MSSDYDVILIGSGISSLTCATILAKHGQSVCLLEQYKKPGGYLHSFKRFQHTYETGAHYVGGVEPGETFHTLLSYMGIYDPELFVPLDPERFDTFSFPSFEYSFPRGYPAIIATLSDRFPHEAAGIRRFFDLVQESILHFQTYHYSLNLDLAKVLRYLDCSLERAVSESVSDPKLKAILFGHCYLHGVRPTDVALGLHAITLDSIVRSPHGFRLGGDTFADRFVEKIRSHGGEVRLGARVTRLHMKGKSVSEVELEGGERLRGRRVISSAHPRATLRMLEPNPLPPAITSRLTKVPESAGIFGVYADCVGKLPLSPFTNYYYFDFENPDALFDFHPMEETPNIVFVSRPDRTPEAEGARYPVVFHSPGPYEWFSEWNASSLGRRPEEYKARKERIAERVFEMVETRVPGLRKAVCRYETSTALTALHFNGSEEGSGYGIYHSMNYTGMRAIGPRLRLENLFLTGQSTLVPGLLGAATSGLRTAGELVGLDGILRSLMEIRDV